MAQEPTTHSVLARAKTPKGVLRATRWSPRECSEDRETTRPACSKSPRLLKKSSRWLKEGSKKATELRSTNHPVEEPVERA